MSISRTSKSSSTFMAARSSRASWQRWQSRATIRVTVLRIEPSDRARLGDTAHRQPVRRGAQRKAALLVQIPGLGESAADDLAQTLVHLAFGPEELLQPLHPLE